MSPASPDGPVADDTDNVYRGITTPAWWVAEEGRPSSAAFKQPNFSVDVASLAGSHQHTLAHLPEGSGIVTFNCGRARLELGFVVRVELDPSQPTNHAHANVYNPGGDRSAKRKAAAQKLAMLCTTVCLPNFDLLANAKEPADDAGDS